LVATVMLMELQKVEVMVALKVAVFQLEVVLTSSAPTPELNLLLMKMNKQ
jgi:hypothetical protein